MAPNNKVLHSACHMGEAHAPNANTGSVGRSVSGARERSETVATDEVREASRSHASDSQSSSEGEGE
jgi:hypothetical protein